MRRAMMHATGLSSSFTLMNTRGRLAARAAARVGELHVEARRDHALVERARERVGDAHDLAGRAHLGAEDGVDARELREREDALLHRDVARHARCRRRRARRASCPAITFAAIFASGPPGRLRDERHRARRARVHLEDVDVAALHRELHVHQADDAELEREHARLLLDRRRRSRRRASAAAARSTSRRSGRRPPRCAASRRR